MGEREETRDEYEDRREEHERAETAPASPLDEARREAEEALATWDVCCKQHEDTCQCGTWPMKDAIRSLLAALPADAATGEERNG